jgi:hypothetical protein
MTGVLYPSTPKNLPFSLFLNKVIHADKMREVIKRMGNS